MQKRRKSLFWGLLAFLFLPPPLISPQPRLANHDVRGLHCAALAVCDDFLSGIEIQAINFFINSYLFPPAAAGGAATVIAPRLTSTAEDRSLLGTCTQNIFVKIDPHFDIQNQAVWPPGASQKCVQN